LPLGVSERHGTAESRAAREDRGPLMSATAGVPLTEVHTLTVARA
jgi:hypothetical protein